MDYYPYSLEGKTVLVTGGAGGIGSEVARVCSKLGARVVLTDIREDALKTALASLSHVVYGEHLAIQADLTNSEELNSLVNQIPEIDGFVCNAGKPVDQSALQRSCVPASPASTRAFESLTQFSMFLSMLIFVPSTHLDVTLFEYTRNVSLTDVSVPETVTIDGNSYTVKAVVKGGFRYCDFDTITLPKTITEIREEAFAYCENLQSFTFPHGMTEIAPSTFLDCRNF